MVKRVHFIGIGGIGMSALARWFLAQNWAVSGSDIASSDMTKALIKEGIKVKIRHKKGNLPTGRQASPLPLVIYNRAITSNAPGNVEVLEAQRLGLCVVPYAKALGDLTRMYRTVAITGSHGKSTTTALSALVLRSLDPTVLLGTTLKEFGGKNIRMGKSEYLVIEADDFGAAFLEYSPAVGIITNIDREHLDFYKTFSNLKHAFLKFMGHVTPGGVLILNKDDAALYSMRAHITPIARKNSINVVWYSLKDPAARKIRRVMQIPGDYNVSNALAAFTLGKMLKIPEAKALKIIGVYRGSWRRQEYRGVLEMRNEKLESRRLPAPDSRFKIQVFDDYAHHPTEIKASLRGFHEKYPHTPLVCVFQPHQSERLKLLFKEFQSAFNDADATLILPIYRVAGRDHASKQFDSEALVRAIQKKNPKQRVFYLAKPENLKKALRVIVPPLLSTRHNLPPVLVMMGAGDIVQYTDKLL